MQTKGKQPRFELNSWFDWVATVLQSGIVLSLVWDFSYHFHNKPESFLSPPHIGVGIFLILNMMLFGMTAIINANRGYRYLDAIPKGYITSYIGILLFALSYMGDDWWHSTFGFETGVDGFFSWSHWGIQVACVLISVSPMRAAWRKVTRVGNLRDELPYIISFTSTIFMVLVIFIAAMPVHNVLSGNQLLPEDIVSPYNPRAYLARWAGVLGMILFCMTMVGAILIANRKRRLTFGAVTFFFGSIVVCQTMGFDHFEYVPLGFLVGLLGDVMLKWCRIPANKWLELVFGAVLPFVFMLGYFVITQQAQGVWWSLALWPGAIEGSALGGLFVAGVIQMISSKPSVVETIT